MRKPDVIGNELDSTSIGNNEAAAQQRIESQLHDAIDRLRLDMAQVELWACALVGFTQPIPGYEADERFRLGGQAKRTAENR